MTKRYANTQRDSTSRAHSSRFEGAWITKPISDVSDVDPENLSGQTHPDFEFNYISLEQVDAGHLLGWSEERFCTAPSRARRVLRYGDILMSTVRPNLLAHLMYSGQVPNAICSTGFAVLRSKREICDPRFLYAHLFGETTKKQIDKVISGSNYPAVNSREIGSIELPFPPTVREQIAIAEVLSDMDEALRLLERIIEKKDAIKYAIMHLLLTRKMRLFGFQKEWKRAAFSQVFQRLNGKDNQVQVSEYCEHGLYPIVDQGQEKIVAFSDRSDKVFRCSKGGLIIFGDHTRTVKFIDRDFVIGADGTQLLGARGDNTLKFFYYQLLTKDIPNTGYNRHFKFLQDLVFDVPIPPEQKAIAAILSDMDDEIEALEKRRDKVRAIKQGMMQQLLTGRVRLPLPAKSADEELVP